MMEMEGLYERPNGKIMLFLIAGMTVEKLKQYSTSCDRVEEM